MEKEGKGRSGSLAQLPGFWALQRSLDLSDIVLKHWGRIYLRDFSTFCWKETQELMANLQPSLSLNCQVPSATFISQAPL